MPELSDEKIKIPLRPLAYTVSQRLRVHTYLILKTSYAIIETQN